MPFKIHNDVGNEIKLQYNELVMEARRLPRLGLLSCKLKRSEMNEKTEESNSISHHIGA